MLYILLSIFLFSFNNILWKKNLEKVNIIFLVSYRAFFTSIIAFALANYFNSFNALTVSQLVKVTMGSIFGVIGLLCMLTVIKRASLHWLGVYNLIGIVFSSSYLIWIEQYYFNYSLVGILLIVAGFIFYVITTKSKTIKLEPTQHLLLMIMTISFSIASIIHWKNLVVSVPPLVILSNQELIVLITSFMLLLFTKQKVSFKAYKYHFSKVILMASIIFLALLFSFLGLKQTDPIISSLLFLGSPLTTIILNIIIYKESLSIKHILAILLMSVGAFILHHNTNL
jgi:drug/metabolite transporter (DMT)-like permease